MTIPPVPPPGSYPPPGGYPPLSGGYPPPVGNYPPPVPYPAEAPLGALPKQAYTSWLTRVAACLIDLVPVAVLAGIGQAVQFATAQNTCITDSTDNGYSLECSSAHPSALGVAAALVFGLLALTFALWNYGYRQGITGSSIGKSIMKFTVVGEATGRPIGFGRSVLRQFAHVIDGLICNIGYLFPLWDAKRQTIADKLMSTVCLPV